MDRRDDVIETLILYINDTKGAIQGEKIDADDPLHAEKKVQDLEQLKTSVNEERIRVRRAFYEEKLFIKSAISDLNKTGERLIIEMKEINKGLNEIMNKQTSDDTRMKSRIDIGQLVNNSMLKIMKKQDQCISDIQSGHEEIVNRVEWELKAGLTEKLTMLDQRTENIANTLDTRLADALNIGDSYTTLHQLIDRHSGYINASLQTLPTDSKIPFDGYVYPGNQAYAEVVRLANGNLQNIGLGSLDIKLNGEWCTVCSQFFTNTEAGVACSMFGYENGTAFIDSSYDPNLQSTRSVVCRGSEESLSDCEIHDCMIRGRIEKVFIQCFNGQNLLPIDNPPQSTPDPYLSYSWY